MSEGTWMINVYDPAGLRMATVENGLSYDFTFDRGSVIEETAANGDLIARNIRGIGLIAQKDSSGALCYYLHNAHGDVVSLVDGSGEILASYAYDAFGNTTTYAEKVENRFKYAGEQFDKVTGQYYLRSRYYDPEIGRFTQEDTYRGNGLNLYTYVANNPVRYIDPWGLCKESTKKISPTPIPFTTINKTTAPYDEIEKSWYLENIYKYSAVDLYKSIVDMPYCVKFNAIRSELKNISPFPPILKTEAPNVYVSSLYYRSEEWEGEPFHGGIDIAGVPKGTNIYAIYSGTVEFSGLRGTYGYVVSILMTEGIYMDYNIRYAHLMKQSQLEVGQEIIAGEIIGQVGSTGGLYPPHLHIDIGKGDFTLRRERENIDILFIDLYPYAYLPE